MIGTIVLAAIVWLLSSAIVGLLLGRMIAVSDPRRDADEPYGDVIEVPGFFHVSGDNRG